MRSIGVWMIILGAGSFLINMMGMEFRLLQWVDNWGPTTGIGIRCAFIALGVVIVAASSASNEPD